jgi:hypothetical protein
LQLAGNTRANSNPANHSEKPEFAHAGAAWCGGFRNSQGWVLRCQLLMLRLARTDKNLPRCAQ